MVYSGLLLDKSFKDINIVFRIPVIDYILVFVYLYVIYVPSFVKKKLQK